MVRANITLYEGSQKFMSTVTELVLTSRSIDSAMLTQVRTQAHGSNYLCKHDGYSVFDFVFLQMCSQLPLLLQLSELYLGHNFVSCGSGLAVLSSYLQTNCSLKVLHINDNVLTDVGCAALAFALRINTSLKSLNMYGDFCFAIFFSSGMELTHCS
jgi:hypothetical protein